MKLSIIDSKQKRPQDWQREFEERDLYLFREELKRLQFSKEDLEDAPSKKD